MKISRFYFYFLVGLLCPIISSYKYPFLRSQYPYDPRIHSLGNTGMGGKVHAEIAHLFTRMIDHMAYGGLDIRKSLLINIDNSKSVLDLCCGTGISTSSNEESLGIDTSCEMISKANKLYPEKNFMVEHAESFCPMRTWDVSTCFFAFHEMPPEAWMRILRNIEPLILEEIIIVDISPNYIPSNHMLMGEPYLEEYQQKIQKYLSDFDQEVLIPNHVHIWKKTKR